MKNTDKMAFYKLVSEALAYWRQDASEFALSVWWNGCEKYSIEQVSKALSIHATDPEKGQFAPKIADVVRLLQGTKTDRSLVAWGKVMEALQAVGAYQDIVFDDPAIHAALSDLGSWAGMCRTDYKELGYLQHRFCQSYKAYIEVGNFDYPKMIGGERSSDGEYLKRGIKPPRPFFVGDIDNAKKVYEGGSGKLLSNNFEKLLLNARINETIN